MSEDDSSHPEASEQPPELFPVPRHFILTPVKDGAYHRGLPTITAVFANMSEYPQGIFLMGMMNVSLDPHESDETKMMLDMFIQPEWEDEHDEGGLAMSEACSFSLTADKLMLDAFMDSALKVKAFTLAVSTDEFYFSCRVNLETTEVTEVRCDWRLLH